ncbi:MAG: hypothetical protein M3297_01205 [Thermoproteota archaeon]|jgi:hypothetical protein|nr:hypothetical protein [Thermoproteota archaeon]
MLTRDKGKQPEKEEGIRDLELENIAGNLLIAEYQVEKLQSRLVDLVDGYRPELSGSKASTHVFKHNNRWYNLSIRVDKVDVNFAHGSPKQEFDS